MSITLFEHAKFEGKQLILTESTANLVKVGFNDKASSLKVTSGTWMVYEHVNFGGRSYQVSPGSYDYGQISAGIGNDAISSVKLVSNQITFFEHAAYQGTALPLTESVPNFVEIGFNNKASSVKVAVGTWILYERVNFQGRWMKVSPGSYNYDQIRAGIGNDTVSSVRLMTAEIILYEHAGFKGTQVPLTGSIPDLVDLGFNDKASSIIVVSGNWTVYEHINYQGRFFKITKGTYDYDQLSKGMGNDVISSVKLDSYCI